MLVTKKLVTYNTQYNTNQIYKALKVTPKSESEARIVSHQMKIKLTFQFLEIQEEIVSFENKLLTVTCNRKVSIKALNAGKFHPGLTAGP